MQRSILVVLLLYTHLACVTQETVKRQSPKYVSSAIEKYGSNVAYLFNDSRSFVLCVQQAKPTVQVIYPSLSYFVYDIDADVIIFEEFHEHGSVKWVNDEQIAVTLVPEIISGVEETDMAARGYIYDVGMRKKVIDKQKDSKSLR